MQEERHLWLDVSETLCCEIREEQALARLGTLMRHINLMYRALNPSMGSLTTNTHPGQTLKHGQIHMKVQRKINEYVKLLRW